MSTATFNSICFTRGFLWKDEPKTSKTINLNERARLCIRGSATISTKSLQIEDGKLQKPEKQVRIGLLGASGYTGAEIVRLLANHPYFGITLMTADRKAGQSIGSVFPHLITQDLPIMVSIKDADFSNVDAVFCCLPHGTTQEIIKGLPRSLKIVDLSADFRLHDISEYQEWYGQPHIAPDLQKEAVYGLTEILREDIKNARLVANPGCYPTSIQLPLIPLIKVTTVLFIARYILKGIGKSFLFPLPNEPKHDGLDENKIKQLGINQQLYIQYANLIDYRNIIIDAKSGVSGAGRGAKEANLYSEIAEGIYSYGVTRHRHVPEIEQGLSDAAHSKITVSFTPHLMPMIRGMQSTIYVEMAPGVTIEDLYEQLKISYKDEEFVKLLEKGVVPRTHNVRGSNYCLMNVFPDRIPGRAIIISVIDNLVKGASGQALQNLNIMLGFPENTGLLYQPLFP
ncbi:hypothetical protein JRO89_XS02G0058700 [Xanthoceras sorbifolium]|uniref:Semialdehyde dehydrogenase NAD-binding domain-containing protein n=1 Tax=Xanthoceras sorbifolium TaxID=99658 RepID=A0ABQ8IEU2_9ROSI|nr:hypothetical protein JRO89_XS02G0058700 [Xanthoceras sorbifolium]